MKKALIILTAAIALVTSSCLNEDIPVTRSVTFKLNPETVVSNLYEFKTGDLKAISSGSSLNMRIYVYDESGKLAASDMQTFGAYTQIMTSNLSLAPGSYKAVAMSNVTGSVEFWEISGIERLNTLKIADMGYIGGESKILGVTVQDITVEDSENTININIQNAGAVACVHVDEWNRFGDVQTYGLLGKQSCDYSTFDNYGNMDFSVKSHNDYGFFKVKLTYDSEYVGMYEYFFTFPIHDASLRFFADTYDGDRFLLGNTLVDDINLGDSYLIEYNVTTEETNWYDMTPTKGLNEQKKATDSVRKANGLKYDYESMTITF